MVWVELLGWVELGGHGHGHGHRYDPGRGQEIIDSGKVDENTGKWFVEHRSCLLSKYAIGGTRRLPPVIIDIGGRGEGIWGEG